MYDPQALQALAQAEAEWEAKVTASLAKNPERQARFETNPTDYLVVFGVVGMALFGRQTLHDDLIAMVVVKSIVLLYACELHLTRHPPRFNTLSLSALVALTLLGWRGLTGAGPLGLP